VCQPVCVECVRANAAAAVGRMWWLLHTAVPPRARLAPLLQVPPAYQAVTTGHHSGWPLPA
jgi:hypothetical protein